MSITERIESVILSNLRPPEQRRIGIEVECLFYNERGRRLPVNPGREYSATDLLHDLETLQEKDFPPATYSLEPGGQLEWASAPLRSLHELQEQFNAHLERLMRLMAQHSLLQLDLALEPIYRPEEVELINMEKYRLMHARFRRTGKHGPWMMRHTTSIQVNIDLCSDEDAAEMAYLADCLEPFCALLFANSPFMAGQPAGRNNLRYRIWGDTDPIRCGNLLDHGIVTPEELVRRYSEYVQTVPAIFVVNRRGRAERYDGTLGEWLAGLASRGELEDDHIQAALHQIFTHVRFKHVLEVRGADRPPRGFELAPAAFWAGLLTAPATRQRVRELVTGWSLVDRRHLNQTAVTLDLHQAGPAGKPLQTWLERICDLALDGLDERYRTLHIPNERDFLEPFVDNVVKEGMMSLQTQRRWAESHLSLRDFLKAESFVDYGFRK
jgi:glutamate--cysteine ligase